MRVPVLYEQGLFQFEVPIGGNREAGVIPARSRHCNEEASLLTGHFSHRRMGRLKRGVGVTPSVTPQVVTTEAIAPDPLSQETCL